MWRPRDACSAPTQASLGAAIATCQAQEITAVAACQAAYPSGDPALESCVTTAQANAYTCRQAALDAAEPGLAACGGQCIGCVRACPAA